MHTFLDSLQKSGQAILNPGKLKAKAWIGQQLDVQSSELSHLLHALYQNRVLEFPGAAPAYDPAAARLGLQTLFLLTCATAFREIEIHQIKQWLSKTSLPLESTGSHFSADLCLQYLPDLRETIARIADGDPLLNIIGHLATKLPLSAVGIPLDPLPDASLIYSNPELAQYYVERVIACRDHARAADQPVAEIISKLVGVHRKSLLPHFQNHTS